MEKQISHYAMVCLNFDGKVEVHGDKENRDPLSELQVGFGGMVKVINQMIGRGWHPMGSISESVSISDTKFLNQAVQVMVQWKE